MDGLIILFPRYIVSGMQWPIRNRIIPEFWWTMIEMISPIPESVAQQDSLLVSHPESIPVCGCDVNGTYVSRASDIIYLRRIGWMIGKVGQRAEQPIYEWVIHNKVPPASQEEDHFINGRIRIPVYQQLPSGQDLKIQASHQWQPVQRQVKQEPSWTVTDVDLGQLYWYYLRY